MNSSERLCPQHVVRRRLGGIVAAGLLLLVACGGDSDGEADADAYVDAAVVSLTDPPDSFMDDETASCVATEVVDLVGVDALTEAGISPELFAAGGLAGISELDVELPDDAAAELGDDLGRSCDVAAPVKELVVSLFEDDETDLPAEVTACLEGSIDNQAAADMLGAIVIDGSIGERARAVQGDAVVACPEYPTALLVAGASGPVSPDAEACVQGVIQENPDLSRAAFADGDDTAADDLGTSIYAVCPEFR
jgi:hypothetical protein